jgi:hypothetical protein
MTWTQRLFTILIVTFTIAGVAWADRIVRCETWCIPGYCETTCR